MNVLFPDAIAPTVGREDEVHNVQAVIDTLSMDKLNISMSHISGQAIVNGNREALRHLLQVFEWLYDYMLDKISVVSSSETSSVRDASEGK